MADLTVEQKAALADALSAMLAWGRQSDTVFVSGGVERTPADVAQRVIDAFGLRWTINPPNVKRGRKERRHA